MLVALGVSAQAQQHSFVWLTYPQWERLPQAERMFYLAGAFDSLAQFVKDDLDKRIVLHYSSCIERSGMRLAQFSDHVGDYGRVHPEVQGSSMQGVMINYLIALCGKPPG